MHLGHILSHSFFPTALDIIQLSIAHVLCVQKRALHVGANAPKTAKPVKLCNSNLGKENLKHLCNALYYLSHNKITDLAILSNNRLNDIRYSGPQTCKIFTKSSLNSG